MVSSSKRCPAARGGTANPSTDEHPSSPLTHKTREPKATAAVRISPAAWTASSSIQTPLCSPSKVGCEIFQEENNPGKKAQISSWFSSPGHLIIQPDESGVVCAGAGRGGWLPILISWLTLITFSAHEI